QAEDGIRDGHVTGVQTCALPICGHDLLVAGAVADERTGVLRGVRGVRHPGGLAGRAADAGRARLRHLRPAHSGIPGPVRGCHRGGPGTLRSAQGPRVVVRHRLPRRDLRPYHPARRLVARADTGGAERPPYRPAAVSGAVVTVSAPAKLNLFLRVLARESDGYHGLETLFCLVSLADTLRAEQRDGRGIT